LLSLAALERGAALVRDVGAGAGFGAGATVVVAGLDDFVVWQAARILLYHLVQSVVVDVVLVVVFTAPGDVPDGVLLAAVRHAALLALPGLVQS
jgi:hypothetical protein